MAGVDYHSCDRCGGKAFYDSDLKECDWEGEHIKALCKACLKTHELVIVPRALAAAEPADGEEPCSVCGGRRYLFNTIAGVEARRRDCLHCNGNGTEPDDGEGKG